MRRAKRVSRLGTHRVIDDESPAPPAAAPRPIAVSAAALASTTKGLGYAAHEHQFGSAGVITVTAETKTGAECIDLFIFI